MWNWAGKIGWICWILPNIGTMEFFGEGDLNCFT